MTSLKLIMIYKNKNLFFAAHDAGAAEILVAIARRNKAKNKIRLNLSGPAIKIFEREELYANNNNSNFNLEREILGSDYIITGTSQKNSHELEAIQVAKSHSKKTISLLDHWTNYKERFLLFDKLILPNQIWVFDSYAEELALRFFKDTKVVRHKNLYIEDQIKYFEEINSQTSQYVLYLCQNLNDHREEIPFNDIDAISFFLKNKHLCDKNSKTPKLNTVCIRVHPSQKSFDLQLLKKRFPQIRIIQQTKPSLLNQISESSYVVGVDTMAMALAVELRKEVFCSIPIQNYKQYFNLLPYEKKIKKIITLKNSVSKGKIECPNP